MTTPPSSRPESGSSGLPVIPYAPPPPGAHGLPEPTLRSVVDVVTVLRRRLWLILGVTACSLGAAIGLLTRLPPIYRASAVVRLVDARRTLTGGIEDAPLEAILGPTVDPILSQIEVLRSRAVAGAIVDSVALWLRSNTPDFATTQLRDIRLDGAPEEATVELRFERDRLLASLDGEPAEAGYGAPLAIGNMRFTIDSPPETSRATLSVIPRERAIDDLLEMLRVKARDRTNIVYVEFSARNPVLAQRVANAAVQIYEEYDAQLAQRQSQRRREFLESQLGQTDSVLAAAQFALSEFRSREKVFSSREKLLAQQSGIVTVAMRREELDADRHMYQTLLDGMQQARSVERDSRLRALLAAPGIVANPVITQLYTQLVEYETERESLTTGVHRSTDSNPDVAKLDTLVQAASERLVSAVRGHVVTLEARIAALEGLQARSEEMLATLPQSEAEELRLLQQVDMARKLAEQVRAEHQRARISEAVGAGQVEIVSLATLPYEPTGGWRTLLLGIGLLAGLLAGSGIALTLELRNTSIRERDEVTAALHVPAMALIPAAGAGAVGPLRRRRHLGSSGTTAPGAQAAKGALPSHVIALSAAHSASAEAYRSLRTNLLFSWVGRGHRSLLVTSASPSDGKSFTAANLAVTFAEEGLRVLLIDGDLHRPSLHHLFQMDPRPGLRQLLMHRCTLADAIRPTALGQLDLLPSGIESARSHNLLRGERMRALLGDLSGSYDLVILDSPPVLAVADAQVLGALADGVIFVVRAGTTERKAARIAIEQLSAVGARVLGAVLNDPDSNVPRDAEYTYAYSADAR